MDIVPNMGGIDKGVRLMAGLSALALGYYYGNWWGLIGLLPLTAVAIDWCPLYALFGITTRVERMTEDTL